MAFYVGTEKSSKKRSITLQLTCYVMLHDEKVVRTRVASVFVASLPTKPFESYVPLSRQK